MSYLTSVVSSYVSSRVTAISVLQWLCEYIRVNHHVYNTPLDLYDKVRRIDTTHKFCPWKYTVYDQEFKYNYTIKGSVTSRIDSFNSDYNGTFICFIDLLEMVVHN